MPLDLLHPAPRRKTPFRDAKSCFGLLIGIASSTVLVVSLAVLLFGQLLFAALPQLCAAIRCCLLRRYIFFAVNFMVLLLVLLKLTDREFGEEGGGGARLHEVSPDEWFDALSSPRSFEDVTPEDKGSIPASPLEPLSDVTAGVNKSGFLQVSLAPSLNVTTKVSGSNTSASPLEPLSNVTAEVSEPGFRVSFLAPSRDVTTKVSGSSTPASFLEPADSSPDGNGSDEFYSCPPTPSRSPVSSPVPAGAVTNVKPSPPAEEADDTMEATWKVICRRVIATLHLKKRSTWDDPSPVKAKTTARGRMRKSERFQEEEVAAPMPEKRMNGKEMAVAKGRDEEADDSMDATWKVNINGGARAAPRFNKSNTWDAPPSVEAILSAARAQLRKSETFREAATGARQAVREKRIKETEVSFVEDRDEMNQRFDTFIKNFNEQLRLQRLASLRRRRYMDINIFYSA